MENNLCFACRKPGHSAVKCPNKGKQNGPIFQDKGKGVWKQTTKKKEHQREEADEADDEEEPSIKVNRRSTPSSSSLPRSPVVEDSEEDNPKPPSYDPIHAARRSIHRIMTSLSPDQRSQIAFDDDEDFL